MKESKKIVLVGPAGVGKTSIYNSFFEMSNPKTLLDESLEPTRGINSSVYSLFNSHIGIKFKQIIYNLLSNAIKFTKKGKIKFEFKENKKDWEFIVKDTGIGISELNYHIIFKDFKRVKSDYVNATQGTGLGLALTKRLINVQGGDIFFNSKVGEGTTFTFNLPKTLKEKLSNVNRVESFLNKL